MAHEDLQQRITTSVRQHLLPTAPPSLRAVVASWNPRRIRLGCYLDGHITEDMRTALHDAGSHLMAEYLGEYRIVLEVQQLDRPAAIPPLEEASSCIVYDGASG